ncbi:MAG: RtcB family protein [Microscillaceae bacterium]|jgi:tRNA-splicing ligase RtcB|nr:RtcB family protein [Microscillaceae bacterium]
MKRSEKINNQDLKKIGFYELDLIKAAGKIAKRLINHKTTTKEDLMLTLQNVLENPDNYIQNEIFGELAQKVKVLQSKNDLRRQQEAGFALKTEEPTYPIYGKENIEAGALKQMDIAMKLPISIAGALMPDAHHGYGLPIGGVLATEADKIIPFAVGVDIACRMCMSIFAIEANYLEKNANKFKNYLLQNTLFGTGKGFEKPMADDLFDKSEWKATKVIRDLKTKAQQQIGTSGTGNHFVEWGFLELSSDSSDLGLPQGTYIALLSHSGSRGFGANIAGHYSKLAMSKTKLPDVAKHLAWLDLNTEEGQEYWLGMNLAGDYASANHHHIHKKMAASLGLNPIKMIENHHNFAWKEKLQDGTEVMVHRKGATPANTGELGIIPGSMTKPGFVVKGKGNFEAINSASHGAGRVMSRSQAFKNITQAQMNRILQDEGVMLIGGDLDEAPMAYKDIAKVMTFQQDLVEILGKFTPKIVRMADREKMPHKKSKTSGELNFNES